MHIIHVIHTHVYMYIVYVHTTLYVSYIVVITYTMHDDAHLVGLYRKVTFYAHEKFMQIC